MRRGLLRPDLGKPVRDEVQHYDGQDEQELAKQWPGSPVRAWQDGPDDQAHDCNEKKRSRSPEAVDELRQRRRLALRWVRCVKAVATTRPSRT